MQKLCILLKKRKFFIISFNRIRSDKQNRQKTYIRIRNTSIAKKVLEQQNYKNGIRKHRERNYQKENQRWQTDRRELQRL